VCVHVYVCVCVCVCVCMYVCFWVSTIRVTGDQSCLVILLASFLWHLTLEMCLRRVKSEVLKNEARRLIQGPNIKNKVL